MNEKNESSLTADELVVAREQPPIPKTVFETLARTVLIDTPELGGGSSTLSHQTSNVITGTGEGRDTDASEDERYISDTD